MHITETGQKTQIHFPACKAKAIATTLLNNDQLRCTIRIPFNHDESTTTPSYFPSFSPQMRDLGGCVMLSYASSVFLGNLGLLLSNTSELTGISGDITFNCRAFGGFLAHLS